MADEHTPSDEFLKAMALVILEWSRTEHVFEWALAELAYGKPISGVEAPQIRAIVTGMDVRTCAGLVRTLFRAAWADDSKECDALIEAVLSERSFRDLLAHGHWVRGRRPDLFQTTRLKAVGKLSYVVHAFSAKQLMEARERLVTKRGRLLLFLQAHGIWRG